MTGVSNRILRDFNRSVATRTVALDIFKVFNRVCHAGFLRKVRYYGISGQIFGFISFFLSNWQFQVVLDESFLQNIRLMLELFKGAFLVQRFPTRH